MTKETMIWQTLSMIIAGMSVNKTLPETIEEFTEQVVDDAMCIIDYSKEDILHVLQTVNCTEFAEILCKLYENHGNKDE